PAGGPRHTSGAGQRRRGERNPQETCALSSDQRQSERRQAEALEENLRLEIGDPKPGCLGLRKIPVLGDHDGTAGSPFYANLDEGDDVVALSCQAVEAQLTEIECRADLRQDPIDVTLLARCTAPGK